MRTTAKFLSLAALAATTVFTSCKKDDATTTPAKTSFGAEKSGAQVFNLQGPAGVYGAYDLIGGAGVPSSDVDSKKDLANTTATGDLPAFRHELTTKNGAKFISIDSTDYFSPGSVQEADTIFQNAGTSTLSTLTNLAAGQFYAAKLRGANSQFALIHITKVFDNGEGTGTTDPDRNKDYIQFSYKLGNK